MSKSSRSDNRQMNEKPKRQLISERLKATIVADKNSALAYDELQSIVRYQLIFMRDNKVAFSTDWTGYDIDTIATTITDELYLEIKSGKWTNKIINVEMYCHGRVYKQIANSIGMDKSRMWHIRRVRNICEKYGIPKTTTECYRVYRLSKFEKTSRHMFIGEIYSSLEWLMTYEKMSARLSNDKSEKTGKKIT